MTKSKHVTGTPLSLDDAIIAHKKAIKLIKQKMHATGRASSMVWVPRGYDLRIAADAPVLKKRPGENGGETVYFLDLDKVEFLAVVKEAKIGDRLYYQLSAGQIVNAIYCCEDGNQNKPLPGIKKKK